MPPSFVPASTQGPRPHPLAALLLAALLLLGLAIAAPAGAGTIARAKLDGARVDRTFIITARSPSGLAVDGAHIYWINWTTPGGITRANLDGTGVDPSFMTLGWPRAVAVDDSHIYWPAGFEIGRANLDGTGVDPRFITSEDDRFITSNLAVGDTHIYWATTTGPLPSFRGNDTVVHPVQNASIPSGETDPLAIAIARANLDGSGVDRGFIAPSLTGLRLFDETTLAVDGAHIYWTTSAGIARANLDGTGVDPSFMALLGRPRAMAVDDAHIYWTTSTGIGRANLDGTSVDPTFITWPPCWEGQPRGLAVDGAYLYWSSREEPPPLGGNRFALGKVKRNATKGTARLAVKVRYKGQLSLAGTKRVEAVSEKIKEPGWVRLPIRPRGAAKQRLATRNRATVKLAITFQGFEGSIGCPVTKSRKLTLVKRG